MAFFSPVANNPPFQYLSNLWGNSVNPRQATYELAANHALSQEQTRELQGLAGLNDEPAGMAFWLPRICAVLAAALIGFGIIFWLAANWADLGRTLKFSLLESLIGISLLGAILRPAAKTPCLLLALLTQGGTLAFFGQTYQTGADPWQLFALWSLLALPLALAARSDALWVPFALIAATGISLWTYAHTGSRWQMDNQNTLPYFIGWIMALALNLWLSPFPELRRITHAGIWSFRTGVALATSMITLTALSALFSSSIQPHYALGLLVLGAGIGLLLAGRVFDVFALSALGLAMDTLLICGLARMLFSNAWHDEWIGALFFLGLFSAGLVAVTAALIRMILRRTSEQGAQA